MKIEYHKKFIKLFNKSPRKIQLKFYEKLELFNQDPFNPILDNHSVDGVYPGWRSINITGDYRALFEPLSSYKVMFMKIGTHSELY